MPQRSTTERGWRLAGLLVLFVIACFWMPLGARDAGGVSSVIPALHASTLAQPHRANVHTNTQAESARRPVSPRNRLLLLAVVVGLLVAALGAVVVASTGDDDPPGLVPRTLRSRGPPVVL